MAIVRFFLNEHEEINFNSIGGIGYPRSNCKCKCNPVLFIKVPDNTPPGFYRIKTLEGGYLDLLVTGKSEEKDPRINVPCGTFIAEPLWLSYPGKSVNWETWEELI